MICAAESSECRKSRDPTTLRNDRQRSCRRSQNTGVGLTQVLSDRCFGLDMNENSTANHDSHRIIFLLRIEYTSRHVDHYRNLFTNILPVCTFNIQPL